MKSNIFLHNSCVYCTLVLRVCNLKNVREKTVLWDNDTSLSDLILLWGFTQFLAVFLQLSLVWDIKRVSVKQPLKFGLQVYNPEQSKLSLIRIVYWEIISTFSRHKRKFLPRRVDRKQEAWTVMGIALCT